MSKSSSDIKPTRGHILVFAQFGLIFLVALTGEWPSSIFRIVLLVAGLALGIWAILAMRLRVSVFPEPERVSSLIIAGPYKYIRHPMYTAVLLFSGSFVDSWQSVAAWVLLLAVLLSKISYEEGLLIKKFPDYKTYADKTRRLLPFIW